jgi:hypothetical protein
MVTSRAKGHDVGMRSRRDDGVGRPFACLLTVAFLLLAGCRDVAATSDPGLFFPTTKSEQGGAVMDALYAGPLVVRDECLLIGRPADYSLPVWWKGFTAERDESGRVVVRDGEGAIVAIEGERFEMGGGYTAEFYPGEELRDVQVRSVEEWLGYPIPDRCLGPQVYGVWIVGDTDPLATSSSSAPS